MKQVLSCGNLEDSSEEKFIVEHLSTRTRHKRARRVKTSCLDRVKTVEGSLRGTLGSGV